MHYNRPGRRSWGGSWVSSFVSLISLLPQSAKLAELLRSSTAAKAPPTTPNSTPIYTGDPNYDIGGSLSPLYYSADGAFNGSGLALATSTFDQSGYGSINLYFQYHDGSIRWIRLLEDGSWQGGTIAEIIAADAKNATPIAAVAYAMVSQRMPYRRPVLLTNIRTKLRLGISFTSPMTTCCDRRYIPM